MASACALAMFSGKIILNFGVQKRLRAFLNPFSHKWDAKKDTARSGVLFFA